MDEIEPLRWIQHFYVLQLRLRTGTKGESGVQYLDNNVWTLKDGEDDGSKQTAVFCAIKLIS